MDLLMKEVLSKRRKDKLKREETQRQEEEKRRLREKERRERLRQREMDELDREEEVMLGVVNAVVALNDGKHRKPRTADKERDRRWWVDGYNNWDDEHFKKKLELRNQRSTTY